MSPSRRLRSAFSLIELLVAISLIALLLALLMGSLEHVRLASRMTQCGSNQRQIGIALTLYSTDDAREAVQPYVLIGSPFPPYITANFRLFVLDRYLLNGRLPQMQSLVLAPVWDCPSNPGPRVTGSGSEQGWVQTRMSYRANNTMIWHNGLPGTPPNDSNLDVARLSTVQRPSDKIQLLEVIADYSSAGVRHTIHPFGQTYFHENGSMNALFAEGHVGRLKPSSAALAGNAQAIELAWKPYPR
jgi:prepilin-type N-terminal cleavage/methylation domain-containing protein